MKTMATLKHAFTIVALILLTAAPGYPHSGHDQSNLPVKWNFTPDTQARVEQNLASHSEKFSIGLPKLDQKIFQDYGINVGNIFKAKVGGQSLVIKRTSLGMSILDANSFSNAATLPEFPIRNMNWVSKIALISHSGHDHQILAKGWIFAPKTADKIKNKVMQGSYPVSVGLSSHGKKVMGAYGIRIGNSFKSKMAGIDITVMRTSGGLLIERDSSPKVASSNETGAM